MAFQGRFRWVGRGEGDTVLTPVPLKLPDSFKTPVIFVDLERTLIDADLMYEAIVDAIRNDARNLYRIPLWAVAGPLRLKNEMRHVAKPSRFLPFRDELLTFLRSEHECGVRIVLATASHKDWAEAIASRLDMIDGVLATDERTNLKGAAKLAEIQRFCHDHDYDSWGYIGDDDSDLSIWKTATVAYGNDRSSRGIRTFEQIEPSARVFGVSVSNWRGRVESLRPYQWIKNLLLFVPLIVSHRVLSLPLLILTTLAVIAFSATASFIYLLNDLLDMNADRQHPIKRNRPLASGRLAISQAAGIMVVLAITSIGFASVLPWEFQFVLLFYATASVSYAFWLKTKPIIDVILLASLYTLRVIAGGAASGVFPSPWLLAFSLFLFTSLAFAKRYAELHRLKSEAGDKVPGRGYRVNDLGLLETFGAVSGYLSVLVIALYIQSPAVNALYQRPALLWLLCPLILYWVSRLWLLARRGLLLEDPIVFVTRDHVSLAIFLVSVTVLVAAN